MENQTTLGDMFEKFDKVVTAPKTFDAVRDEFHTKLGRDSEAICPCCDRLVKIYRRKLNSGMAHSLIWLVKAYQDNPGWIDVQKKAPRYVVASREIGKLAHWGLVSQRENDDKTKRTSGLWRPTTQGIEFSKNLIPMESHVFLLDNEVQGFSKSQVYIQDALGSKFDYQEVMNGFGLEGYSFR